MADTDPFAQFATLTSTLGDLFGTGTSGKTSGTASSITEFEKASTGRQSEQLKLDEAAIQKIIEDVLGGPEGLAGIFQGEQTAGIFSSSVAAQAAGDLASKLVGELAKLTAERVTTREDQETGISTVEQQQQQRTKAEDEGVISGIGSFFGF